jgi:hypothetical protein
VSRNKSAVANGNEERKIRVFRELHFTVFITVVLHVILERNRSIFHTHKLLNETGMKVLRIILKITELIQHSHAPDVVF